MALVTVKPTKPDVLIARTVARKTNHRTEMVSRELTWGADEKMLLADATAGIGRTAGANGAAIVFVSPIAHQHDVLGHRFAQHAAERAGAFW